MPTVLFNDNIEIITIPNRYEEDRMLSPEYYRGLISKCEYAEENICRLINRYSSNKIIIENDKYDENIKIFDSTKGWDEDDLPCKLLNDLKNKIKLKIFILYYNYQITQQIKLNHIGNIRYTIGNIIIYANKVLRKM